MAQRITHKQFYEQELSKKDSNLSLYCMTHFPLGTIIEFKNENYLAFDERKITIVKFTNKGLCYLSRNLKLDFMNYERFFDNIGNVHISMANIDFLNNLLALM
jgi:hypothetical protein